MRFTLVLFFCLSIVLVHSQSNFKINLNKGDLWRLEQTGGITAKEIKAIYDYQDCKGDIESYQELVRIPLDHEVILFLKEHTFILRNYSETNISGQKTIDGYNLNLTHRAKGVDFRINKNAESFEVYLEGENDGFNFTLGNIRSPMKFGFFDNYFYQRPVRFYPNYSSSQNRSLLLIKKNEHSSIFGGLMRMNAESPVQKYLGGYQFIGDSFGMDIRFCKNQNLQSAQRFYFRKGNNQWLVELNTEGRLILNKKIAWSAIINHNHEIITQLKTTDNTLGWRFDYLFDVMDWDGRLSLKYDKKLGWRPNLNMQRRWRRARVNTRFGKRSAWFFKTRCSFLVSPSLSVEYFLHTKMDEKITYLNAFDLEYNFSKGNFFVSVGRKSHNSDNSMGWYTSGFSNQINYRRLTSDKNVVRIGGSYEVRGFLLQFFVDKMKKSQTINFGLDYFL